MNLLTTEKALLLGALLCYFGGALSGVQFLLARQRPSGLPALAMVAVGWILQTVVFVWRWVRLDAYPLAGRRAESLLFLIWGVTLLHLTLRLTRRAEAAAAFAMPVVVVLFCGVFLSLDHPPEALFHDPWIFGHIATVMLAYGAFLIAGAFGLMYLIQVRQLRQRKLTRLLSRLPPIESIEWTMVRHLALGLPLMTCSLALGAYVAVRDIEQLQRWVLDPKVMTALGTWAFYAVTLAARWRGALPGERMAGLAIVGFCGVVTTYLLTGALAGGAHPFR